MNPGMMNIVMIVAMFRFFYFLLIRPQPTKTSKKQLLKMQSELKKGDAIVTIGGLHGTIETVDETKNRLLNLVVHT